MDFSSTNPLAHWASDYIGLPWCLGGRGPERFDCWSFFIWIQGRHFGRHVPFIPVMEGNLLSFAKMFQQHPERARWHAVERPDEGDGVLMRQSRYPIHVGVWVSISPLEEGVLHCLEGSGVVFQTVEHLALSRWQIEGFYRLSNS